MANGYIRITTGPKDNPRREYQHRVVAREAWGEGPQECAYCGREVRWEIAWPHKDALIVDHVDENHSNNAIENLVPACGECNARRSANSGPPAGTR